MTMPWIALVCDISGVCSVVGTLEMTSKPTKAARTRIASSVIRLIEHPPRAQIRADSNDRRSPRGSARSFRRPLVLDRAALGDAGGGDDVVLEVDLDLALLGDHQPEQVLQV